MNKMKLISHYDCYGRKDFWDENSDVYAITDDFVMKDEYKKIDRDKKVALLIEPRAIVPEAYDYVGKHYDEFKYVFTGDDELLKLPNAKPIIWGGVWYRCENPKKEKLICMISSNKEMCDLHKERKRIARKYKDKIDVYGTIDGGTYIDDNIHKDYMYEVVIENDEQDIWFTEKICNCFANKTIPIYYGARDIGKYFNLDAIIECKSINELENKIEAVINNEDGFSDVYYEDVVQKAIEENYELSKQYENFDTWFYNRYEKEIEEMF
jgi:hypothetical protein